MEIVNSRVRVFCLGELGKRFYANYGDKLGERFSFQLIDDTEELLSFSKSGLETGNEKWILITEYEPQIWEKECNSNAVAQWLRNVLLKIIVIHPHQHIAQIAERRWIQMMKPRDTCSDKVILAMPDVERSSALNILCKVIYDLISAAVCSIIDVGPDKKNIVKPGYISLDYNDLFWIGKDSECYGMIYSGECENTEQICGVAKAIGEQLRKDLEPKNILFAILIITSNPGITLRSLCDVAIEIESLDPDLNMVWAHNISESKCRVSVVVYCRLEAECDEEFNANVI